jgi:exodeoxyribonuclease-5
MILSNEQQTAMDAIFRWIEQAGTPHSGPGNQHWMFYLGGYAGTGKTTLLQEVINRLPKSPKCLAPTGKAASVLQKKLKNAVVTTVHKALYKPVMPNLSELQALELRLQSKPGAKELLKELAEIKQRLASERLRFMDNPVKEISPGDLVMVDEASMVTKKMVDDLYNTDAIVLFVGDPGQLPPVGDSGYFSKQQPDAMLSQIQRQALDNPIINLSMKVRNGDSIPAIIENDHIIRRCKKGYLFEDLAKADQVLTGMNHIRRRINRSIRKVKGYDGRFPVEGEKIICLKNQYVRGGWVVNGMQCMSASPMVVTGEGELAMDVLYEGQILHQLCCYHYPFEVHYNDRAEEDPWAARGKLSEFDYGYAITVHKSQGSEWNRVVLVDDEMMANDWKFRRRWLYTAVTRAKEHLIWLTNE